jgi:hypothetical protein
MSEEKSSFEKLYENIKDLFSHNSHSNLNVGTSGNEKLSNLIPPDLTAEKIDNEIKECIKNETGLDRIKRLFEYELVKILIYYLIYFDLKFKIFK